MPTNTQLSAHGNAITLTAEPNVAITHSPGVATVANRSASSVIQQVYFPIPSPQTAKPKLTEIGVNFSTQTVRIIAVNLYQGDRRKFILQDISHGSSFTEKINEDNEGVASIEQGISVGLTLEMPANSAVDFKSVSVQSTIP